MHCYLTHPYDEPTVWVGLEGEFDERGRVTTSYPARYYNTLWRGHWGPILPKRTSHYGFGASLLFERDEWGPDVMTGFCPTPKGPVASGELSNRVGRQFDEAFTFARLLGVKTCLGTEAPLKKFMPRAVRQRLAERGKAPGDASAVGEVYEGIFERIKRTHPLDYYWIWTPENWTWRGNSAGDMQETLADVRTAVAALREVGAPFRLATCGWVLGPRDDRAAFGRMLPGDIAVSAISRQIGYTPLDPAFGEVTGRRKWAIPWLESDDFLASPQLWVGRTRKDAADALAYRCDGLMGLHWRTRIVGPNASALAQAAWDQSSWNPAPGELLPNTLGPLERARSPKSTGGDAALGGKVASYPGREIAGTDDDPVYRTCRYDLRGYRFRVPDGTYRVTLRFCEPHFASAGQRVCDVKLQGRTVIERLDIFAEVGQFAAYDRSFEGVEVTGGRLRLDIAYRKSLPCISGVVIEGSVKGRAFTKKINCGGPAWRDYAADALAGAPAGGKRTGRVPRAMPVEDFYADWALASFGPEVAREAAAVFVKLDGRVPHPIRGACPAGRMVSDPRPWAKVAPTYVFVDELAALRAKVRGAGNLERFDYWLDTLRYLRAQARVQCALGRFDTEMKKVESGKRSAERKTSAAATALPLYKELVRQFGDMVRLRLEAVSTHGGIATVVNLEQNAKFRPAVIDAPGRRLARALGGPLPPDALP
ncbi:MAG: malectin domain-containing carbohydrate-binding protein, partial [Planctomycetota bacterium]